MFAAWCEVRRDFRTFRIDRISAITVSGDHFISDETTDLNAYLANER